MPFDSWPRGLAQDRPEFVLARHFFKSLFDFGFLSEDGSEALKRAMLGSLAVALALGCLLVRMFMKKYGALSPEAYQLAVMADHAFLMAVPMWFVAAAIGLVGESLFPDQTDYRILMAEPLSRPTIFGAKLVALLLFGGLFVVGSHLMLLPLATVTMLRTGSFPATATAFAFSSALASLFAALAIVAVHGLLVLLAPRARILAFSGAVRSVMIGGLLLSLPLVARLPAADRAFAADAWWLPLAPPAWFVGLERWLIGDASRAGLAAQAAIGTVVVLVVSVISYVLLYRRFDRVTLQPTVSQKADPTNRALARWNGRAPVRHAIGVFVAITIRRSALHQGLVVGLLAAAGGFVLNSLLNANGWYDPFDTRRKQALINTLFWAPMTMIFVAIPAMRLAIWVPLDLRSNWIFRMTEDVAGRAEVAAANVRAVLALAVAVPLALIGPLQWWTLGSSALGVLVVEASIGWLLVEWTMADWRRVPFTCSYIPGKGFVPHMFVKGFASYIVFSVASLLVLRISLTIPAAAAVFAVVFGGVAGVLSFFRSRQARETNLIFEDELPTDVTPLRLSAD
jgi:hypothetical protein